MSCLLLFPALNYLFSALCYLKNAFLLANHNREIFACILLGSKQVVGDGMLILVISRFRVRFLGFFFNLLSSSPWPLSG